MIVICDFFEKLCTRKEAICEFSILMDDLGETTLLYTYKSKLLASEPLYLPTRLDLTL